MVIVLRFFMKKVFGFHYKMCLWYSVRECMIKISSGQEERIKSCTQRLSWCGSPDAKTTTKENIW